MCKRVSTARIPMSGQHGLLDVGPRRYEPEETAQAHHEEQHWGTPAFASMTLIQRSHHSVQEPVPARMN